MSTARRALAQVESRALAEAGELERQGRHADAAARYRGVLRTDPTNLPALLGLERVFTSLERLDSLVPLIRTALTRDSLSQTTRSLELRVWFALGQPDSVTAAARRWIALAPRSPDPYREWAFTVAQRGDLAGAKRALSEGVSRLGDAALAQDLAQLTTLAGEWIEATRQWVTVVRGNPALLSAATGGLTRAPALARDEMLSTLLGVRGDSTSRRMAADLLVGWGRPDEAWPLLDATLPPDSRAAAALLQRFAERAGTSRGRRSALARGYALERLAGLVDAAAAGRVRLQAAQAYADAGDLGSAQRMLDAAGAAGAAAEAGGAVGPAMASLIRALAEQGSVEEAERRLRAWRDRLSGDDLETLRESIAWAWTRRGELDRAEAVLAPDSGVAATAVRGWIALYRGDLSQAREHLRAAGPYTGSREEATRRMSMLVLVERLGTDRLPEFGRAVLALARGDTLRALADLDQAARKLGGGAGGRTGGRADVLGFAGELALVRKDYSGAEDMLRRALAEDSVGPAAPAAELALARVQAETGRTEVAIQQLEHLILAHPQSAMVPQARRLRDRLRGVVPD
jgi:tetratricopeptide (TPR) repeat protein